MAYLYRHIRKDIDDVFYIGIGEDDIKHQFEYTRAYSFKSRNKHWEGVTKKTQYYVEIMLDNLTWEEACLKEIEFISLYGRKDLGLGPLVNMTDGGNGLYNPSQETRLKKSNSQKKFHKSNPESIKKSMMIREKTLINHPDILKNALIKRLKTYENNPQIQLDRVRNMDWISIGKKISKNEERNKNISKAIKKPIIQYDLQGNIIRNYDSIKEASEINGYSKASICCNLKNKTKTAYGFKWIYE